MSLLGSELFVRSDLALYATDTINKSIARLEDMLSREIDALKENGATPHFAWGVFVPETVDYSKKVTEIIKSYLQECKDPKVMNIDDCCRSFSEDLLTELNIRDNKHHNRTQGIYDRLNEKLGSPLYVRLDCREITSRQNAMGYFVSFSQNAPAVILIEHFDELPQSENRQYIENILIHCWESDFFMKRDKFLVIFTTSNGTPDITPQGLSGIKELTWYGDIVNEEVLRDSLSHLREASFA